MNVAIESALGHAFADPALLESALTHRSYSFENGGTDNERLEYLGDSILNACTTALLVDRFPSVPEGPLSRLRSRLVNTSHLASIGLDIGLGAALQLGRGEEATGGRTRESVLADATEALIGAVFIDAGFECCRKIVTAWMTPGLALLDTPEEADRAWIDPRSELQELTQRKWRKTPTYEVMATAGPAHAPEFEVAVCLDDRVLGTGKGSSKREASKEAASVAVAALVHG